MSKQLTDIVERLLLSNPTMCDSGICPILKSEAADEIVRLRSLAYQYPPSEPYNPDGVTWRQECERLRDRVASLESVVMKLTTPEVGT